MINIIVGGVGSGKSISAVKEILKRNMCCFVNFDIDFNKATRLRLDNIITEKKVTIGGRERIIKAVNWEFWNNLIRQKKSFDIYIDEAHNVINSRMSMTKENILFMTWLAQVRKILGESEQNNLTFITQRITSIDIAARELSSQVIFCRKISAKGKVFIINTYFKGTYAYERYMEFAEGSPSNDGIICYYANPLFRYFPSHSLITFGDDAYL